MGYIQENMGTGEEIVYEANLHWVVFCSVGALLTLFIAPIIRYMTSEFAVTNHRVIVKTGWISRHTLEMSLSKIESVTVSQSVIGRILNYGLVELIGSGGTREVIPDIADPARFRRAIQELQT